MFKQTTFNRHPDKNILFHDRHDWSTEAIIAAYRNQAAIEAAFREMKDPHFLGLSADVPSDRRQDSRSRLLIVFER